MRQRDKRKKRTGAGEAASKHGMKDTKRGGALEIEKFAESKEGLGTETRRKRKREGDSTSKDRAADAKRRVAIGKGRGREQRRARHRDSATQRVG